MKFKKALLPFITGALALSLAACSEEDKAAKKRNPRRTFQGEKWSPPKRYKRS